MYQTDHIVLAAPDLEAAKAEFEARTGVAAVDGGPHQGMGTRNALIGIDDSCYLEIIAPDPAQPPANHFGAHLARLPGTTLLHWALRATDLPAVAERARGLGFDVPPVRHMSRTRTDGVRLSWSTLGLQGHDLGGLVPFFIDWGSAPHPARTAPRAATARFEVTVPDGPATGLLDPMPSGVVVHRGEPGMRLIVGGRAGVAEFSSARPAGFRF